MRPNWLRSIDKRGNMIQSLSASNRDWIFSLAEVQLNVIWNHNKLVKLTLHVEYIWQEEETLLNFYIGNLEYACGTNLRFLSAINWDQNEDYPQFSGGNILLTEGYAKILGRLSEGLDVMYNSEVCLFIRWISMPYFEEDRANCFVDASFYIGLYVSQWQWQLVQSPVTG